MFQLSSRWAALAILGAVLTRPSFGQQTHPGLANHWVLIIRHGEKPETGTGLTSAGEARAKAYVNYFSHYNSGGVRIKIGRLIATKDSKKSWRERLTLTPLSQVIGIPLEMNYKDHEYGDLVNSLDHTTSPANILICWHHGSIPGMVTALGGDATQLIGSEKWPDDHFDWVIQLHYDAAGRLIPGDTRKVVEPTFR